MKILLKSLFVSLYLGFFCSYVVAQEGITFASQHTLKSTILDEKRIFSVYLPPSYEVEKDKTYSVLFVLDGDQSRLLSISGVVEALSSDTLENQIQEFIIVAVPNTNRDRDLTPTATDLIFKGRTLAEIPNAGGANQFLDFLQKELMPKIDRTFRTNGNNTLVGISFGGLLAAHTLLTRPDMFDNYLIIDATYVWDNNYVNRIAEAKVGALSKENIGVYIALANNDHIGEHGVANRAWGNEFLKRLSAQSSASFRVFSDYFPHERHGTVELIAWYHGLKKLFAN